MKISQRLDYNRLAEVLSELGVVDQSTLQHILQQSFNTGELFPEVLVREGLIADWELSRIICDSFHLVFLSVDFYEPSKEAVALINPAVLHQHCIVPLDVYDNLITVAMPGLSPSEILKGLSEELDKVVQPVVGTVASNRRWLVEHAPIQAAIESVVSALPGEDGDDWGSVFDEGDAAVLMDLGSEGKAAREDAVVPEQPDGDGIDQSGLDDLIS